jgi:hypothetical protein
MKKFLFHLIHGKQSRYGGYMVTFSGRQVWPLDLRVDDIFIEDLAHHGSLINRFNGATRVPVSLTQHSLLVEDIVTQWMGGNGCPQISLKALLHDTTEMLGLNDMITSVKHGLPQYKRLEHRNWKVICERFDLNPLMEPIIKEADMLAMFCEKKSFLPHHSFKWCEQEKYAPLAWEIKPMSAGKSEIEFLNRFHHLRAKIAGKKLSGYTCTA